MSYFYWITGLAFAVLFAACVESTLSRNDD